MTHHSIVLKPDDAKSYRFKAIERGEISGRVRWHWKDRPTIVPTPTKREGLLDETCT